MANEYWGHEEDDVAYEPDEWWECEIDAAHTTYQPGEKVPMKITVYRSYNAEEIARRAADLALANLHERMSEDDEMTHGEFYEVSDWPSISKEVTEQVVKALTPWAQGCRATTLKELRVEVLTPEDWKDKGVLVEEDGSFVEVVDDG